jgi:DNA-binding GntR family transcriptional regulator
MKSIDAEAAHPGRGAPAKLGSRHSPLTKLVTDAIRERILAGEFAPGERLAEERLSEELGVSRMPVREALRVLASEGVVTIEPRRGASVTVYSDAQVQELIEVRATLEGLNARLAAKRHDPKQIAELERILADAARITEKSDLAQIQAANERFHKAVEQIAANSVLMNIVRSLRDRTALIFAKRSRARVRQNWDEHAGIVRAVISGDAELAGLLASRHVYNAAQMPEEGEKVKTARSRGSGN